MSPTRVAVIGAGAIGGTIAAWLTRSRTIDVALCVRAPFERLVVDVPGGETIDVGLPVLVDPADATPVDWAIVATKTYDAPAAARWVERLAGPTTRLVVVQNGVEHLERFREVFPVDRTLPAIVDLSCERRAPGRIRQRSHGRITVPEGDMGQDLAGLFAGTPIEAVVTPDFTTAAWRKLALNSAGVVHALTRKPAGIARRDDVGELMRAIALETIRVGRAVGAALEDEVAGEIVDRLRRSAPDAINSLLADRLASRPMEIDARNGVVVRLGAAHGVPTPLNAMAVTLLAATVEP